MVLLIGISALIFIFRKYKNSVIANFVYYGKTLFYNQPSEKLRLNNTVTITNSIILFQELARYMLYLDSNDVAYNRYFEWRKHYIGKIRIQT